MKSFFQSGDTPAQFSFVGPQFVVTPISDGRIMLILSGVVIANLTSGQAKGWHTDQLDIHPDRDIQTAISRVAPKDGNSYSLAAEQWATFGSLSSIFDKDTSVNAGFAVDEFEPIFFAGAFVGIRLSVAVQDRDASLLRVGYHATIIGTIFVPPPITG